MLRVAQKERATAVGYVEAFMRHIRELSVEGLGEGLFQTYNAMHAFLTSLTNARTVATHEKDPAEMTDDEVLLEAAAEGISVAAEAEYTRSVLRAGLDLRPAKEEHAEPTRDSRGWRPMSDSAAFAWPFGTIRVCLGCTCLMAGGALDSPPICRRCATEKADR